MIAKVGREYDKRFVHESDDLDDLISLTLPKKATKDNCTALALFMLEISQDNHRDPFAASYKERDLDKFLKDYNSDNLSDVIKEFYKRVESLNFSPLTNKKLVISTVNNYNFRITNGFATDMFNNKWVGYKGSKDPKDLIILNFKDVPDNPW